MQKSSAYINVIFVFIGLGVFYLSRFLLRKYPKLTSNDLKRLDPDLEGIRKTYINLQIVTTLSVTLIFFLVSTANPFFWQSRASLLLVPAFAVLALFDGLFALRTKVFPTTSRGDEDGFVYDKGDELWWVAFWQIGLLMILLAIDYVAFVYSL